MEEDAEVIAERAVKRQKLEFVLNELDTWLNPAGDATVDADNSDDGVEARVVGPKRAGEVRASHSRLTDAADAYYALLPKEPEPEPEESEDSDSDSDDNNGSGTGGGSGGGHSGGRGGDGGGGGRGGQALNVRMRQMEERVERLETLLARAYSRPLFVSASDVFGHVRTETTQHITQKVSTLSRKMVEWKPLCAGILQLRRRQWRRRWRRRRRQWERQ